MTSFWIENDHSQEKLGYFIRTLEHRRPYSPFLSISYVVLKPKVKVFFSIESCVTGFRVKGLNALLILNWFLWIGEGRKAYSS